MVFGKPILRLQTRITLLVCVIVLLALGVTGTTLSLRVEKQAREALAEKAILVSRLIARSELVVEGLQSGRRLEEIQALAEGVRTDAAVDFVVVFDMNGARLSHPNVARIGDRFQGGDDAAVYRGETYTSVAKGTLGESLRAFTPVREGSGRQVGAVAVGILTTGIDRAVAGVRRRIGYGILFGFAAGMAGATLVARRIKKVLMGMEPPEIAAMLQQRNALIHSVREGVVAIDGRQTITVVNEEATRLFRLAGIHGAVVGAKADGALPNSALKRVLETGIPELDEEQVLNGLHILTNRVPVLVGSQIVGAVATFRDKTEINQLAEQLTGVRLYVDALRAQTHEFMNKLHVILGLIRLKEHDRLAQYISGITETLHGEVEHVTRRVKDPVIAGFILAKCCSAREQGIATTLTDDSRVLAPPDEATRNDVITVLGNLLENAMEAIGDGPTRKISLGLWHENNLLHVRVEDSGMGIAPECADRIFKKGFSTKGPHRGYGLYHVLRCVEARGGQVAATRSESGGAIFSATLRCGREEEALD